MAKHPKNTLTVQELAQLTSKEGPAIEYSEVPVELGGLCQQHRQVPARPWARLFRRPVWSAGATYGGRIRHSQGVASGASDDDLRMAELGLGVTLPLDLREILRSENGSERWYGDTFLITYGTDSLVAVNHEVARFAGFLVFASDGSREMIGYDLRANPPVVVMLDIMAESWSDGLLQAESLNAFIERLKRGEGLRWDDPYAD